MSMSKSTLTSAHLDTVDFKLSQFSRHSQSQQSQSVSDNADYNITTNYTVTDTNIFKTDAPTVYELKTLIPLIFAKRKPLSQYFSQEMFLAQNLNRLDESFTALNFINGNHRILQRLNKELAILETRLSSEVEQLLDQFQVNFHSMSLQILSNVRTFKNMNNSRIMINGLLQFKYIFQNFVNSLSDLDEYIQDINDLVDEWNRSSADAILTNREDVPESSQEGTSAVPGRRRMVSLPTNSIFCKTPQNSTHRNGQDNGVTTVRESSFKSRSNDMPNFNQTIYEINNKLSDLSNDTFETLINKVLSIFDGYVELYFKAFLSDKDYFNYEVISL